MERQPKIGDKIRLIKDRGDGKKDDILTLEYVDVGGDTMRTIEFWHTGNKEKHCMCIKKSYKDQGDFAENEYEIY